MNRTELIEAVVDATGLERRQAEAAVMAFIDSVVAETKAGNKVSVFGFGTFTPGTRAARTGRNPQTGAAVKVPAKKVVRFTPAAAYKTALNTRGAARKSSATKAAAARASAKKAATGKAAATKKAAPAKATARSAAATKAAGRTAKAVTAAPAKRSATKKR